MANLSAEAKMLVRGSPHSVTQVVSSAPFQAESAGVVDVPDLEGTTAHAIPFGSIATEATVLYIKNRTGQDCTLKMNGATTGFRMASGASILYATPAAAGGASKLTQASMTTVGTQSGAGFIDFLVLGDPV